MLTLRYKITREDYINYYTYVTWDAPENLQKRRKYFLKHLGIIVLFTGMFYFTGLFDRSSIFAFLVIAFILLTTLVSMTGIRSSINKQAQTLSDDPYNSSIFLPTVLTASDTGILLQDELTETNCKWQAFVKKQENKDYYFLFFNALQAIVIPKRVFRNTAEKSQFDKLLSQFISLEAEVGSIKES